MYDTTKPVVKAIQEIIKSTWDTPYCYVTQANGPYPRIHVLTELPQVDHTDGIGTKGDYHWRYKTYCAAAIDAIAMNVNDLLLMGAVPFKVQNHIIVPEDNNDAILEIIKTLAEYCKESGVAMTGGETSVHHNATGLDISLTMSGVVLEQEYINQFNPGSTIIGLPSSGIHSNGITRLTEQVKSGKMESSKSFTTPTEVYCKPVWEAMPFIEGMCHVTGGAFTKLKGFIEDDTDVVLEMPAKKYAPIFQNLFDSGIPCEEMYRTFNCGWGFLIGTTKPEEVLKVTEGTVIGKVVNGTGCIKIKSAFTGNEVIY